MDRGLLGEQKAAGGTKSYSLSGGVYIVGYCRVQ